MPSTFSSGHISICHSYTIWVAFNPKEPTGGHSFNAFLGNKTKQEPWQKYVFLYFSLEKIFLKSNFIPIASPSQSSFVAKTFSLVEYQQFPNTSILNQNITKKGENDRYLYFGSIYISACIAALVTDLISYNKIEFSSSTIKFN